MYNLNEEIITLKNRLDYLDNWEFNIQMSDRITAAGWETLQKISNERIVLNCRLARLEALA